MKHHEASRLLHKAGLRKALLKPHMYLSMPQPGPRKPQRPYRAKDSSCFIRMAANILLAVFWWRKYLSCSTLRTSYSIAQLVCEALRSKEQPPQGNVRQLPISHFLQTALPSRLANVVQDSPKTKGKQGALTKKGLLKT